MDDPSTARPISLLRVLFGLLGVAALICGYLGLAELLAGQDDYGDTPLDIIYYDLQLFVLGSPPLDEGGPFPPMLDFARFAAPTVTVYALAEASRLIFAAELRRLRTRNARGHAIVCGQTPLAATLVRRLRAAGEKVVVVQAAEPDYRGPRWVAGDARDPAVLRAAGIERAATLYACTSDSATNTAIALAADRHHQRYNLRIYAEIRDPELCLTLQARYLGLGLDFFHADHVAARRLRMDNPLGVLAGEVPRVMVASLTPFGRAVVVELARFWAGRPVTPLPRLPVHVVDRDASAVIGELCGRYPFLPRVCELTGTDSDLETLLRQGLSVPAPQVVFLCDDDEERALRTALIAERLPSDPPASIIVRLDRLAELREIFETEPGSRFDQLTTRISVIGVPRAAGDPALIRQDLVERLAQVVHDRYLREELANPDRRADRSSLRPWDELPEGLRAANRAQAEDFGNKLRAIGCVLAPRVGPAREHELTEAEIEMLARAEHERWRAEREAQGWRFAPEIDEARRLHPGLVEWEHLPAVLRRPNYHAVRAMPQILADAGFRIVELRS